MENSYTYRRKGWDFISPTYAILFQGTLVRTYSCWIKKDVEDLVFLLNTAYEMGVLEGEFLSKFYRPRSLQTS